MQLNVSINVIQTVSGMFSKSMLHDQITLPSGVKADSFHGKNTGLFNTKIIYI